MTAKKETAKKKNSVKKKPGQQVSINTRKSHELTTLKADLSPMAAMQFAVGAGADLDKLEKMLALQAKWEEREAKKAYVQAMAEFKKSPPAIGKDTHVKYKNKDGTFTEYNHASLGNVTRIINTALSEHDLSAAWSTKQSDNKITVTCTITHKLGHNEKTELSAASDSSGGKNAIQAVGSTITYLERYTLLSLTGLATDDQDNDGRAPAATKEEKKRARAWRADYNKKLQAATSLQVYENIAKSYRKLIGSFEFHTYHNESETFLELFNEHKARIDHIEKDNSGKNIRQDWIERMKKCDNAVDFRTLEEKYISNSDIQDKETADLIDAAGEELQIPNYINH